MAEALTSVIAHSDDVDIDDLAQDIIEACQQQLAGIEPKAGILFAGINLDHQILLDAIHQTWPKIHLIGCTTDGECSSVQGTLLDSATLMLMHSETMTFTSGALDQKPAALNDHGVEDLHRITSLVNTQPALGIVLADGLLFNGQDLLQTAQKAFGDNFLLCGGMAGDQWQFTGTKQFHNNKVLEPQQAVFLFMHGDINIASAISIDWQAIGEIGTVTRSEGNSIYEINHRPALKFFHDLLGEEIIPSNDNPVAVYNSEGHFQYLRTCFENFDPDTGTMHFIADIPQGSQVQLTVADRSRLVDGAITTTRKALQHFPNTPPSMALCISCGARRALLGSKTTQEIDAVRDVLGNDIPLIGFYSYGEIAPPQSNSPSQVHNETFSIILLG